MLTDSILHTGPKPCLLTVVPGPLRSAHLPPLSRSNLPIHSVLQPQQNTYNSTMLSPICMCCFTTSPNLQWLPLPCSVWLSHLSKASIKILPLKHLQGVRFPLRMLSAFSSMLPKVLIMFIKTIRWKVLSSLLLELSHSQQPGSRI